MDSPKKRSRQERSAGSAADSRLSRRARQGRRQGESRTSAKRGERVIASRRSVARAPDVRNGALRALVKIDLVELLNTTNLDSAQDSRRTCPHVRKSILNYGFPDYPWRTTEEHGDRRHLQRNGGRGRAISNRGSRAVPIKARREASPDGDNMRLRFHRQSRTADAARRTSRWNSSPRSRRAPARSRSIGCRR